MKRCSVVVERGENNCSACSRDVPGCVATGKTVEETPKSFTEALDSISGDAAGGFANSRTVHAGGVRRSGGVIRWLRP